MASIGVSKRNASNPLPTINCCALRTKCNELEKITVCLKPKQCLCVCDVRAYRKHKSQLTSEKDLKFEFWAFDAYYTRYT